MPAVRPLRCVGAAGRCCQIVKMSNESREKGLPCAQIRVGDRRGPSRTIREMHAVALSAFFLSFLSAEARFCGPDDAGRCKAASE